MGIDVTRYMFLCALLIQWPWNLMFLGLAFFAFKNFSKCHREVIPECRQLRICKIKFSEKVYIFMDLLFSKFMTKKLPLRLGLFLWS